MSNPNVQCSICKNVSNTSMYDVPEMMQGTREVFTYLECGHCKSLGIQNPPAEYAGFYQGNYYSTHARVEQLYLPRWRGMIKRRRDNYCLTGKGFLGRLLNILVPNQSIELKGFQSLHLQKSSRILDVGCGTGKLTYCLYNAGFTSSIGVEPFLESDIRYANGLRIQKGWLKDVQQKDFDLIMFNHSFEHLPNPHEVLEQVKERLAPAGKLYIRIPTTSSYAWKHYRENWVQLDAPRHVFLYSIEGIKALAVQHGFRVERVANESTSFQFIGSEQYKMGIPMYGDKRSWFEGNKSLFTPAQIKSFEKKAKALNESGEGDSIAVTLSLLG